MLFPLKIAPILRHNLWHFQWHYSTQIIITNYFLICEAHFRVIRVQKLPITTVNLSGFNTTCPSMCSQTGLDWGRQSWLPLRGSFPRKHRHLPLASFRQLIGLHRNALYLHTKSRFLKSITQSLIVSNPQNLVSWQRLRRFLLGCGSVCARVWRRVPCERGSHQPTEEQGPSTVVEARSGAGRGGAFARSWVFG